MKEIKKEETARDILKESWRERERERVTATIGSAAFFLNNLNFYFNYGHIKPEDFYTIFLQKTF